MAIKRTFQSLEVKVVDGGKLAPDLPSAIVGAANYTVKQNWRRDSTGLGAREVMREGWDYFKPNSGGSAVNQKTVASDVDTRVIAIGEVTRPSGLAVTVAISTYSSNTLCRIKWFDYDNSVWTEIGSGYSAPPDGRRWQIISVGPYAVFSNGIDLPCTWLIGDAAVTPMYELREQGVASVGSIWESNQVLMCGDILEIPQAVMITIMNGLDPYGRYTAPSDTQRIQYRIQWSNTGDPRDHASTVNGSATAGSPVIVLTWPVASIVAGDSVTIIGAGTAGGNLVATVLSNVGTNLTLTTNAVTSISSTPVQKTSALNSIVGFYEFEDGGTPVIRGLSLQNRIVVYKTDAIFVGYYTGDLDEPFVFERQYRGNRTPRFRWTLIDVGGEYHLFAGSGNFYRFRLGVQEPEVDDLMANCKTALFYDVISTSPRQESNIFAVDNGVSNEIFFMSWDKDAGTTGNITAYDYERNCVSVITKDSSKFSSAATIHRPISGKRSDPREVWFVFGDLEGFATKMGRTNLGSDTYSRYGAFDTAAVVSFGRIDFGDKFNEKDVRSWVILTDTVAQLSVSFGGSTDDSGNATVLETKTLPQSGTPRGLVPLFYRKIYFADLISAFATADTTQGNPPSFYGRVWEFAYVQDRGIARRA